ncbi:MAG: HEPN domain-containing protein [Candidatus Bathyarchaeia archaeon]
MPVDYWKKEALRWLKDAIEDLSVAEDLLKSGHYSASCFHSQQAAEKAVKAMLYEKGVEARGHSILALVKNLEKVANTKHDEFYEDARTLDRHYAPTRYPNLHPGMPTPAYELYSREDAEKCLKSSEKIVNYAKKSFKNLEG